jgi:hypothetical protein
MTIAKKDLRAALTCLVARFPQTFALEEHQPHSAAEGRDRRRSRGALRGA